MSKRILLLVHPQLIPPKVLPKLRRDLDFSAWICEFDVMHGLLELGHDVEVFGVDDDLLLLQQKITEFKPHLVFNLLEQFAGNTGLDQNVVSFLQMQKVAYSGCCPQGLMIARNKALAKKIMRYHRIPTPRFHSFYYGKKIFVPRKLQYPLLVKCMSEDASLGLSQSSVVSSEQKLIERVDFMFKRFKTDVIAERFIEGREITLSLLGNHRLQSFPPCELFFKNVENPLREVYTERSKWSKEVQQTKGISVARAKLAPRLEKKMTDIAKRAFRNLFLTGYARMDFRITADDQIYLIEANPNPNLASSDEFALSAGFGKVKYQQILKRIVSLGLKNSKVVQ